MAEKISGIYRIVCVKTGRYYFGSSIDIWYRWRKHLLALRKGTHCNIHMNRAYNKHGESTFRIELTELVEEDKLLEVENVYLKKHVGKRNCFNVAKDATAPMKGKKPEYSQDY